MARPSSTETLEIRAALAAPLFGRVASLVAGHVSGLILLSLMVWRAQVPGVRLLFAASLATGVARVWLLRARRRDGRSAEPGRVLAWVGPYCAIGLAWSAVSGISGGLCVLLDPEPGMRLIAITLALGTAGGIASRNAGTPRFAVGQILLWIMPVVLAAAMVGGWYVGSALLNIVYILALLSIVARSHSDTVGLIRTQHENATLMHRFSVALDNMVQGLTLYDASGRLLIVNQRCCQLFGLPRDGLAAGLSAPEVLERCALAGIVLPAALLDRPDSIGTLEDFAAAAEPPGLLELANGRFISVVRAALDDGGWLTSYEDVTERRRHESRIAHIASHDALTGLPNRALFRVEMGRAIGRLQRGEPFCLLYMDLDRFKAVNDTHGHQVGDQLLAEVSARVRSCLRRVDTVARLGGDEFAVILPGLAVPDLVAEVAQRLVRAVGQPYRLGGRHLSVGLSVGIAMAPQEGTDAETLVHRADAALYAVKHQGRNGFRFATSSGDAAPAAQVAEAVLS